MVWIVPTICKWSGQKSYMTGLAVAQASADVGRLTYPACSLPQVPDKRIRHHAVLQRLMDVRRLPAGAEQHA